MPSPFPGMDPYLEGPDFWSDLHSTLIPLIREQLVPQLPPGYSAKIDQYIWLQEAETEERVRRGKPDVVVAAQSSAPVALSRSETLAPSGQITLPAPKKRKGNRYIKLLDTRSRRVVTVIELLSPSNKLGEDRKPYLAKREEYIATGVNLVEIDLLRDGDRMPFGRHRPAPSDYYILVCKSHDFPNGDIWTFTVRDSVPPVPVPLQREDGWVRLDLQKCLDHAYDASGYADEIDYTQPSVPPLRATDAEWAATLFTPRMPTKE